MTANPIELIGGLTSTSNVPKADVVAWAKARVPQVFTNPAEVNGTTLTGQNVIYVKSLGAYFVLDATDTTTPNNGTTVLVSSDGKRFKIISAIPAPTALSLGGVYSSTAPANNFATGVDTSGNVTYARPSAANLSNGTTGTGAVVLATAPNFAGQVDFVGGTVTTSQPVLNATQTWNAGAVAFTGAKLNVTDTASAAGSLLLDLQVGGVSMMSVRKDGYLQASVGVQATSTGVLGWVSRSDMRSPADGVITLSNEINTDFGLLQFGGATSAFPAIARNGAGLSVRLADDSADADLTAANVNVTGGATSVTNGMYLGGTDLLAFATGATARWGIASDGTFYNLAQTGGLRLNISAASATTPTIVPNRSSSTTGFGAQAAGNISTIIAGVETLRFTSTGLSMPGASAVYVNFDATAGSTGYGLRSNAGAVEVKPSGGAWDAIASLTATQTLTNKTLTSPTINSPTMTTPTLGVASATSVSFGSTVGDKLALFGNTYGFGIESNTLTAWSANQFRWRVGGSSSSAGTEEMLLNSTGLTLQGALSVVGNITPQTLTASRLVATDASGNLVSTITSANLAASVSDETGSGALVFATSPALVTPNLGTPSAGVLTNCTGLPTAGLVNNAVTFAKMQTISTQTFLGRTTAATGNVENLTATQATAILNAMAGDSGTGGTKGLVPAPGAGDAAAGKYLDASGAWSIPAGGGGGGMTDTERQESTLTSIYLSKSLGNIRRMPKMMTTGLRASTSALRGLTTETNADVSNAAASGYVSPSTAVGTVLLSTQTFSSNNAGWSGYNVRQVIAAAALGASNLTAARVVITGPSSGADLVLASAWLGQQGASAPNFDGNQVQLSVGGNTSFTVPAGGSVTTDPITIALDHTKNVIVSYGITSGDFRDNTSATNFTRYYKAASSASAGTTTLAGTTTQASSNFGVTQIYQPSFNNMTLVTTAQTTAASVSNARVLLEIDNSASPTLNTDLTVEVTCNGGTNWTTASLSSFGPGQDGNLVVETVSQATTSGTSFAARVKTLNNKNIPIYGIGIKVS